MMLEYENNQSVQTNTPTVDENKKTILIYSPDLNFCFSLSMLFQDRYNVITTTDVMMLEKVGANYAAHLIIVDASPSQRMIERLHSVKASNPDIPIIMLYVYSPKDAAFDRAVRGAVDAVFYKPFDLSAMSKRINELLPS